MLRQAAILLVAAACLCGVLPAANTPGLWIDVPFVAQSPGGCGAASIAMVMRYWAAQQGRQAGPESDDAQILKLLHSSKGHGIYASAMKQYLEEHGFRVFTFSGKWEDFTEHLGKGRPLIVALRPLKGSKMLHYVVVAGIEEDMVMYNDPAGRKLTKLDRKTFEEQWKATSQWTLLAVPIAK